jgi:hypothetical protein
VTDSREQFHFQFPNQHFKIGRRFAEAVFTSAKEGRLTYQEAYQLTDLKGDTFAEFAKHLGNEV